MLDESATLDAPADTPVPERTLDNQHQADNEDSDDEISRPVPSTYASTSASAKKTKNTGVNESACEALDAIQNDMLHKLAKIDAGADSSFGRLMASHLVQIKSNSLRRNVELDMLKLLYGVLEE